MRIEIEIPKEFEYDYKGDMFKDFFSRVLCDIEKGKCLCGNYEKETAEMFLKAFDESKIAFDTEKVVEQIHDKYCHKCRNILGKHSSEEYCKSVKCEIDALCDIVKKGGVE